MSYKIASKNKYEDHVVTSIKWKKDTVYLQLFKSYGE